MTIIVGIVFGGSSTEHNESIRAAKTLYDNAIKSKLDTKYTFEYFYLDRKNRWAGPEKSFRVLITEKEDECRDFDRMLDLSDVDVIYSTLMGTCGENGNIMGVADILNVQIIGCGILASALCLDKRLSKMLAEKVGVPTVECIYAKCNSNVDDLVKNVERKLGFPCFLKPTNLGTCAFVSKTTNCKDFVQKWNKTISKNSRSSTYVIEKFIPNTEVRVFIYEDLNGDLHTNDEYVTELKERALDVGGSLFNHFKNNFSDEIRNNICKYATRIFRAFELKDYARIDFFVDNTNNNIYFNEVNSQPMLGTYNIKLMKQAGYTYAYFIDMMIKKNISC
jgi:D-alanine-D-alanine ligase